MSGTFDEIDNIGESQKRALAKMGVTSPETLLNACRTATDRAKISRATGIPEAKLLEWANLADLMRVPHLGPGYAQLLLRVGVTNVAALGRCGPDELRARLEAEKKRSRVRRLPAAQRVREWIETAAKLGRSVE